MAFFRGGRRADWKNGGLALLRAQKQIREGIWPVGRNDDKSIVWQGHPRKTYPDDHHVLSGFCLCGDFLVFSCRRLAGPIGVVSLLLLFWAWPNYIWTGEHAWMKPSAHASLILGGLGLYYSILSRHNQFVIFDRRSKLVHVSQYLGRRFHTVSWEEFDYIVIDHHTSFFGSVHEARILTAPPPWSLENDGLSLLLNFKSRFIESTTEAHTMERTPKHNIEGIVEFIIDFMNQKRTHPSVFNLSKEQDSKLTCHAKDNYANYRSRILRPWSLVDPERLPDKPNWKKDGNGMWKKMHDGTIARAGWFGLWGVTHTLPPHLRGTRADPEYKNDLTAPRPGLRWHTHENEGTGELANQPEEVIEAVLTEGMGALEHFPDAAERALTAREEAVTYHNANRSWIISPDA